VFLAPGRSAVFSQYAFAVYPLATLASGAEPIVVAARDFAHDLDAMRAAIRPDTRLLWIANPNNPTGTFLPHPELRRFLQSLPAEVVAVSTKPITNTCRRPSGSRRRPGLPSCRTS
jgi:histidinol-phosphate aminotransferase